MSYETDCVAFLNDELEFTELVEVNCSEMRVLNGKVEPCVCRERARPEIEIAIPGERALAEFAYRTADGRNQYQTSSERQVSIIAPHQLHQLNWLHGADLTLFR